MPRFAGLAVVALLAGCTYNNYPPAPEPPRDGTSVAASFGRAWDAVIDAFADRGISIETLDRASGLIVPAGQTYVPAAGKAALQYADCGMDPYKQALFPERVRYNVVVRGDSASSVVKVRAFFETKYGGICSSKGLWEQGAEAAIKERAERKR